MRNASICMLIMLVLSGCSYFQIRRPIIEQGNVITSENVGKLHPGMSEAEVIEAMGTPVLSNIFTPERMEYVYTMKERTEPLVQKRVTCLFSSGRLVRVEKS